MCLVGKKDDKGEEALATPKSVPLTQPDGPIGPGTNIWRKKPDARRPSTLKNPALLPTDQDGNRALERTPYLYLYLSHDPYDEERELNGEVEHPALPADRKVVGT